jgi:hypothetical protein
MMNPPLETCKKDLVPEWIAWRNAAETLHRRREERAGRALDVPVMLVGFPLASDSAGLSKLWGLE